MPALQVPIVAAANTAGYLHNRVNGIDVFRFLAVVGVIFIHANTGTMFGNAFDLASRFGVPFFFIVAGYFAGLKVDLSLANSLRHVVKRVLIPFVIWLAFYFVYLRYDLTSLISPRRIASTLVNPQPAFHLWFLTSLAFCTLMLAFLRRLCGLRTLVALALAFYVVGLVIGPYARFFFSSHDLGINPRNGPFFGFPFMVLGYSMRRKGWEEMPFLLGVLFFVGGLSLTIIELYSLHTRPGWVKFDILIGTVPMGAGAFIMALKLPNYTFLRPLARLGRYSLGIFALHLVFLIEFTRLFPAKSFEAELAVVVSTIVAASVTAVILGQFRLIRPIVC